MAVGDRQRRGAERDWGIGKETVIRAQGAGVNRKAKVTGK